MLDLANNPRQKANAMAVVELFKFLSTSVERGQRQQKKRIVPLISYSQMKAKRNARG